MKHNSESPYAHQNVAIKKEVVHPQFSNFGGNKLTVEDWWDRVSGKSWMSCDGNPACLIYAIRAGFTGLPTDDEVLYGKTPDGLGHLVHISEIEIPVLITANRPEEEEN